MMRLASVNLGRARELDLRGVKTLTGIFKQPVARPVHVGQLGLESDVVADGASHGGPDQAIYVYGSEDYDWWSFHYRRMLEPGIFGENLTVDGLESEGIAVGDRLTIGDTVVLEVTGPRVSPAASLAGGWKMPSSSSAFVTWGGLASTAV
jgi:MOSC domain-containing protein YiiM